MKKTLIIVLTLILIIIPVHATQLRNRKDQLNNAKQAIKDSKIELELTKEEKEKVKQEIQSLDEKIVMIENKILEVENQLTRKEEDINQTEVELEKAIQDKEHQFDEAKDRLVQMYKNKRTGYMKLLFSCDKFWQIINRAEYVKRIANKDDSILVEYERQVVSIDNKKEQLEQQKADIELLFKEQVSIKSTLNSAMQRKNEAFAELAGEEEQLQAQIKEMEQISKDLEAEIRKLTQKSTIVYAGGPFLWPVPGNYRISSEYNPRSNPISGKYEFHSGIDIPAPYGTEVLAAADGVVITSGWVNGYGNTVMINHGSGLVTLYGHNSSLVIANGQTVKKGDVIARVGSTGYSTGNHSHFEVRVNGSHVSPWNYIKKG